MWAPRLTLRQPSSLLTHSPPIPGHRHPYCFRKHQWSAALAHFQISLTAAFCTIQAGRHLTQIAWKHGHKVRALWFDVFCVTRSITTLDHDTPGLRRPFEFARRLTIRRNCTQTPLQPKWPNANLSILFPTQHKTPSKSQPQLRTKPSPAR
jgi:hypothetical protein